LLMRAALAGRLQFGHPGGKASWLGWALAGYAVIYPLAGLAAGHIYPRLPMFGITPCPVTLFTCGLLLLTTAPPPRGLLPIPFIWSVIGGSAAILLGMAPDWPLWIAAAVIALLGSRHRLRADATAA
jgi:MFS family permease